MATSPADAIQANWAEYTTHLSLRQGRFRIELFNKKAELLATREVDTRNLLENESVEVAVIAHPKERIATVVLRP